MTYNLLNGAKGQFNYVVNVINEQKPDFVTINEANGFDLNDNKLLKQLSNEIKLPYRHLAKCGDGDGYHVALYSKYELLSVREIESFARAAVVSKLNINGYELTAVSTHLTPYSEAKRIKEAELITNELSKTNNCIVMGDLNSLSQHDDYNDTLIENFNDMQKKKFTSNNSLLFDVMKLFEKNGLLDTAVLKLNNGEFTAPTSLNEYQAHSNMRLDYILVSESLKGKVKSYDVIKNELTEIASDHYPVVVDLVIPDLF